MGLFDRVRQLFAPSYRVTFSGRDPTVSSMTIADLYRSQPNLRAVVSFLADNAASVPWKIYDRRSDGDRQRVTDSPAATLLSRPNRATTAFSMRRAIFADILLYDSHLSIVTPDKDSVSGWSMWRIPPSWVVGYVGGSVWQPETYVIRTQAGQSIEVPAEKCLSIVGYGAADPMRQTSPVEALRDLLSEQLESSAFRRQMWSRGGRFNAYITRPKDVEPWTDEGFERFERTFNESWAGRDASKAGAMPILEDGMDIKQMQFNARDAEWADAKKLGREDVAAVYHVNPALIWPGSGQTYASAKDNARALYAETLTPRLMEVTDAINAQLLPMVGEDSRHYLEYDLTIKLQGSFEERASVLQSAVGGPWMTRAEARAQNNLPHIDGTDELIVPLNVVEGGLASPNDTDPTVQRNSSSHVETKDAESVRVLYKAAPTDEDVDAVVKILRKHFDRQKRSIMPRIQAARAVGDLSLVDLGDMARWDDELAADLLDASMTMDLSAVSRALEGFDVDWSEYDTQKARAYLDGMCKARASKINSVTLRELQKAIKLEISGDETDALKATPEGVFDFARETRSEALAKTHATQVSCRAAVDGASQLVDKKTVRKRWVLDGGVKTHRPDHAKMSGEIVKLGERFSNGARYPGDYSALGLDGICGCMCSIELVEA